MRLAFIAAAALSFATLLPGLVQAADWAIDAKASSVRFVYLENQEQKSGHFGMISPQITLDPDNLTQTRGVISVSTDSLDLGDSLREGILVTRPWLDTENFPDARFAVERVEPGPRPDQAVAVGRLEIKGVSHPLSVPLAIQRQGEQVSARGELRFDRTTYGLRDAVLESFVTIGTEITLGFELVARFQR